ncbi:MAG: sigma-70 family RNA polymerase sigma factor [Planctomycetes bacterium]|nr:sigma-70 family RNA polymerase sigma factor [Planctomycetota bacterium]
MTSLPDADITRALEREARSLRGFLWMLVGQRETADELFQETCLRAWEARHRFRSGEDFGAWLRGIARHLVLRERRARNSGLRASTFGLEVVDLLQQTWVREHARDVTSDRLEALTGCVEDLDEAQRVLLQGRYGERKSHAVIAGSTNSTEDAVKVHLYRIRKKLQDCVKRKLRREGIDVV